MSQKYSPTTAAVAIFDDTEAGRLSATPGAIDFQIGLPLHVVSYAVKLAVVSNATDSDVCTRCQEH